MYCDKPKANSKLIKAKDTDLVLEGPLDSLRPHVASVILDMSSRNESCLVIDAYRLIEIFLQQDVDFETTVAAVDVDLLVILLGFADPPNKYLPELLMQAYVRRNMLMKPTWTVLGLERGQIARKYSEAVFDHLERIKTARMEG